MDVLQDDFHRPDRGQVGKRDVLRNGVQAVLVADVECVGGAKHGEAFGIAEFIAISDCDSIPGSRIRAHL